MRKPISKRWLGQSARCLFMVLMLGALVPSYAVPPPLTNQYYPYVTVEQDLPNVLRAFGANTGIPVKVGKNVRGKVRGKLAKMTEREFLDFLTRSYNLAWYYDGSTLHFSSAQDVQSKMVKLNGLAPESLKETLQDLGVYDERYTLRPSKQADVVMVSGPEAYVSLVEETVGSLSEEGNAGGVQIITGDSMVSSTNYPKIPELKLPDLGFGSSN